jgi:hypothetical protein
MRGAAVVGWLILVACGASALSPAQEIQLDREFTLAPGGVARTADLRVSFDGVAADSRCPIDALCVWEGDAVVALSASVQGRGDCALELHTAGDFEHERACATYRIRLDRLMPAPVSASPIPAAAYRATLVVSSDR